MNKKLITLVISGIIAISVMGTGIVSAQSAGRPDGDGSKLLYQNQKNDKQNKDTNCQCQK